MPDDNKIGSGLPIPGNESAEPEIDINDDLTDYIEGKRLTDLKSKFASAEEDEDIRSEGFGLASKGGLFKKSRPGGYGYYYEPSEIHEKSILQIDNKPLTKIFEETQSNRDNDQITFKDIGSSIYTSETHKVKVEDNKSADEPTVSAVEETDKEEKKEENHDVIDDIVKKYKNISSLDVYDSIDAEAYLEGDEKESDDIEEKPSENNTDSLAETQTTGEISVTKYNGNIEETSPDTVSMNSAYNTNTRVVFVDPNIADGIKKNTDDEMTNAFLAEDKKRHKRKK